MTMWLRPFHRSATRLRRVFLRSVMVGLIPFCLSGCARSSRANEADDSVPVATARPPSVADDRPASTLFFQDFPNTAAIAALRSRARLQREGFTEPTQGVPVWLPESEHIRPENMELARASLESVLAPIRESALFADRLAPIPPTSAESQVQALRLYARGRLATNEGQMQEALTAFEQASRLDPSSPQIWHGLGNVQLASGLRSLGMRSQQRAAELGFDHVRVWAMIGLEAVRRRDTRNGLRWLVAAYDRMQDGADSVAVSWIEVSLGEVLLGEHAMRAGSALIRSAMSRAVGEATPSSFQDEYATLVRRRPQLWLRVGDAEALIGDWSGASESYLAAADGATGELVESIALRRVAVLMASGRTAESSLELLARMQSERFVSDDQLRTLGLLGTSEPSLADAVADIRRTLSDVLPSIESRFLLAQLAARSTLIEPARLAETISLQPAHVVLWLRTVATEDERWAAAQALAGVQPSRIPVIAEALVNGGLISGPNLVLWASSNDALGLRVRVLMGLVDRREDIGASPTSEESLIAQIDMASLAGRWDFVEDLVGMSDAFGERARVRALSSGLQPTKALEVWRSAFETSSNMDELLLGASIAADARQREEAASILMRAWERDPSDERVYERMVELVVDPKVKIQRSALEEALRSMREHVAGSLTMESLEVAEMIQRGFGSEAERRARGIIERLATIDESDFGVLLSLWQEAAGRKDLESLAESEAWLRGFLDERIVTQATGIALAKLIAMQSGALSGRDTLTALPLARTPRVVEVEASFVQQANQPAEAFDVLSSLYDKPTLSVEDSLRLAQVLLVNDQPLDRALSRLQAFPDAMELPRSATRLVVSLCNGLMSGMSNAGAQDGERTSRSGEYAQVSGFAVDHGTVLPEPYHRVRLRVLALAPGTTLDEMNRATRQLHEQTGLVSDAAFEDVFNTLIERSRTQDALLWVVETLTLDEELNSSRFGAIVVALASLGSVATIEVGMERLESAGMLRAAVEALAPAAPDEPKEVTNARAELSYLLAGIASSRNRESQAEALYELALRLQPDHPWACNDYGYLLVDRDDRLDEAARLLAIALKALPDRANVLDSVGWLRYKQGRFVEPDGTGAVGYLRRAIEAGQSNASAAMYDHLGDATWMAGLGEESQSAWEQAEILYLRRVREFNSADLRGLPVYNLMQSRLGQVRQKLRSLEIEGVEPQVATTAGTRMNGPGK